MNLDQSGTLSALRELRFELFDPSVIAHCGNVVKCLGDGWVVEFSSVSDAVTCATTIQTTLAGHDALKLRIGIHIGEVVFQDDDVFGNGVNVAARLEALAEAGQVLISGAAYECLDSKTARDFQGGEDRELKNIDRPIPVWWWGDAETADPLDAAEPPASSDRTAIAVLPFDNISDDPEQEYFSDGLTEDIITALSKYRWFEVVARNTTFAYKGKSPNVRQLADELDADYVVEGSVRKAGTRIRVSVQLIDASTGNHVWAERYDRQLEDVFDVQDEITETIVGRLEPEVGNAIRRKVEEMPRRNPHAWDCYHLGLAHFYKFTAASNREAQRLFLQSRELDPRFPEAHAWWAYAMILGMVYWDTEPDPALMNEALAATRTAVSLDNQNALLYVLMGRVQLARREYRKALAENETAIKLNPTLAPAYCGLGDSLSYEGRYEEAMANFEKAVEMSPNHPQLWAFLSYGALTLLFDQQFEKALDWAERARDVPNCQYWATAHAAVALANLGRTGDLEKMVHKLMVEEPNFTRSFARKKLFYLKREDQMELYLAGLAKAGIPA